MGDAAQSAAYGKAVKAAGWLGLGCLQVALQRERNREELIIYFRVYVGVLAYMCTPYHWLAELRIKNCIKFHNPTHLHIILLSECSVTFSKTKFTLDTQSSN